MDMSKNILKKLNALKTLKAEIEKADKLVGSRYAERDKETDQLCFCAVGHVFKMGGASDGEIEALGVEQSQRISTVLRTSHNISKWVKDSGLEDIEILKWLQEYNDQSADLFRKDRVLEYIVSEIKKLEGFTV